ncbi:MAG: methylated-DNA--[protein]-cysteine S-methyltransferase [Gammaproteobacteria bacterium]|nr:methylated-DNA--[protein]-cysteine S-methyltransferase [Gammaproteobacteria bacterium]
MTLLFSFSAAQLISLTYLFKPLPENPQNPDNPSLSPLPAIYQTAVAAYLRDAVAGQQLLLTLPVLPQGTPFQQRVWQAIAAIAVGQTRPYGELAKVLQSSPRAVAAACAANPLPLIIPCHRVVAKNGLGGFIGQRDGKAVALKRWLLQHEGAVI